MLSDLEKRFIEFQLDVLSAADLVRWARAARHQDATLSDTPDLEALAQLPLSDYHLTETAPVLFRKVVANAHPQFDIRSKDAEAYGRSLLLDLCKRLVVDKTGPYRLCQAVGSIEVTFDYPEWLGDFVNQCDWCEPNSTRENFGHLIEYAERFLAEHSEDV
jgi:hypothetical protein